MADTYENDRSNLGIISDPNIKIKPGKKLQEFLNEIPLDDESIHGNQYLTLSDVKKLWKKVKGADGIPGRKVYLHELMNDSELMIPNLVIPERNPELEKRVQALRRILAEKEYQRMVQNVSVGNRFKAEDTIGHQMKLMNTGLIGVFQFIISIAAAFFFGFIGIEAFGGLSLDLAVRLLLGIVFALVVGLAELYFLAVNLSISESPTIGITPPKKEGHHLKLQ